MDEFKLAGKKPGLQVWRIEKLKLAPVPACLHKEFFKGDCYIVLCTSGTTPPSYSIHTWMGNGASQDERGAAAIFMTQMDDHLGGFARQSSEYHGNESTVFRSYFRNGIVYKEGGIASGFKHVEPNAADYKVLLHVKGRRKVEASEVPISWRSFNSGDCFIFVLAPKIYVWCGSNSNHFERVKANQLAIDIRDTELSGRGKTEIITEGSEPDDFNEELSKGGPKPEKLPEKEVSEDADESEKQRDQTNKKVASLYLISDADGTMDVTLVAEKNPFRQDMLSTHDCYILDNGMNKTIFVWKGKMANADERKKAYEHAREFIRKKNYPRDTRVEILPEDGETSLFKQFFHDWLDKDETTGPGTPYILGKIAKVEQVPFDASKLHEDTAMAAQHCMVDDGSGEVQVWRVEGDGKESVDESTYGQFFGGDCYLVLYTYSDGGRKKYIIYTWQGLKCSKYELGASAVLTVALDDSYGQAPVQVRVTQGQEPPHFVSLFQNKPLVIHLGGTCREHGQSEPGSTRLFHIRESSTKATRAVEVEPTAASLNTNDVFVLKTEGSVYLWKGKGKTDEEMATAKLLVKKLWGGASIVELEETQEPSEFWDALGGKGDYQTSMRLSQSVHVPRLFACSNKTGRLVAEEVPPEFTQMDLATDDIMILDTGDQIFVWVGKDANEAEKAGAPKIAQDYLDSDPSGRGKIPCVTIKQDAEVPSFTGWFHAWDSKLWEKDPFTCMPAGN